ncbi:hypothetical protein [uncultured Gelidibacter sp.]|uniref:hypothetical protein n=1 Tax=uncultured Gelidibacter sp. TaxID=259318 RepID=UPI0026165ED9|nr:hypothetical protein [uncultured Gelidibacter sp.]
MNSNTILKKDYIAILIISVLYFLMIKNVVPATVYLIIAIIVSLYFFPLKLFLKDSTVSVSKKKTFIGALSYYVTGNIIALSALVSFQDGPGFINTAITIYSLINFGLLVYFYMTENISYNFILTCCVTLLTAAVSAI